MRSLALMALAATLTSGMAIAKPTTLTDRQMDKMAGGMWTPHPVGPPVFRPPPVVQPPIVNPGGPILISCIVGQGCTTRRYNLNH
jgi:hypothetical protein